MKKKFVTMILALSLTFSLTVTSFAATWDNVDDYEKLSAAFGDTEENVHIILSGNITNDSNDMLTAHGNQKYVIDGNDYTLADVNFNGTGKVEINGDIISTSTEYDALNTYEEVSVTVNGNIEAVNDAIDANESSSVVVNGTVKSGEEDAVDADDEANVIVNGDVYGGFGADGVDASGNSKVTVNGDVYGGDGQAPDEDGNLFEGNMSDPGGYSDGGDGVEADVNAQVTVNGNVYGGDAYGTYGYGGDGLDVYDTAKVVVSGDVVGGNHIADPNVSPGKIEYEGEEHDTVGFAGDGVSMDSSADVTIGGNAIGGDSNGQKGTAGSGVYVYLVYNTDVSQDTETGETVSEKVSAGQLTLKGSLVAGEATGEDSTDGDGIYVEMEKEDYPLEGSVLPEEVIEAIVTSEDLEYVRYSIAVSAASMINETGVDYIESEIRLAQQEKYYSEVAKLAEEYGVDTDAAESLSEIVNAVPDEKIAEFAEKALKIMNEIIEGMELYIYAIPEMTVGGVDLSEGGVVVDAPSEEWEKLITESYLDIQEKEDPESGTPGVGDEQKPNDEVANPDSSDKNDSDHKTEDNDKETAPKTGDYMGFEMWYMMLIISAVVLFSVMLVLKKKRY